MYIDIVIVALATFGALSIVWKLYRLKVPPLSGKLPVRFMTQADDGVVDPLTVMSNHLGRGEFRNNEVRLLVNGDRIFPPMLAAIEQARHTVHLLTYVYWHGEVAQQFKECLIRASRRGVCVRVLVDAFGSHPMQADLVAELREAGVQLEWFHPIRWYNLHRLNLRTHRKIMVVDSKHAFVGGVGIAQEWMGDASSSMEWRDNHFAVTGPVVSAIEGGFTRNWLDATGELLVVPRIDQSREGDGCDKAADTRLLVITAAPRGSQSSVAIAYWASIKAAQHSVDIATPYFVPDKILLGTLLDAAQRGIRVRLIVPGENTDSNMVRWACRSYYAQLLNAGVDVYEFNPSMMHTKLIVIDAKWSLFGSSNFDHRSVALNDEILLIADDEQLAGELIGQYDKDVEGATQVMSARHKPLRRIQRFISSVALVMRSNL